MERSKIPVHKSQATEKSLFADQVQPFPKKPCPQKPLYSKDPNIVFSSTAPDMVVFKAVGNVKKTVSKKASAPTRGPANKYKMEAELRDRNRLLEAANVSLHSNLTSAQEKIKEMTKRQEEHEKDLKELNRRLEKNMIILENRNIDPVSGDYILASAEENSQLRTQTKIFTEKLINELQTFNQTASQQRTLIQTVMAKWKEAEQERKQFVEEQQAFQKELEQFRESLQQAEQRLDM
ncbi:small kinetochore-associated protein [Rhinophrynus dorsalis]